MMLIILISFTGSKRPLSFGNPILSGEWLAHGNPQSGVRAPHNWLHLGDTSSFLS